MSVDDDENAVLAEIERQHRPGRAERLELAARFQVEFVRAGLREEGGLGRWDSNPKAAAQRGLEHADALLRKLDEGGEE